jgi:hypothetical protein
VAKLPIRNGGRYARNYHFGLLGDMDKCDISHFANLRYMDKCSFSNLLRGGIRMSNAIQLTPDFRIKADERQFIVEERYTVKPPVNPREGYVYVPRQEWREAGYYSLSAAGLTALLESVALRTALAKQPTDLTEFAEEIRSISRDLAARVSGLLPEVTETKRRGSA